MAARRAPRPLIVKIGGSLAGAPMLAAWLAALDRYPEPLVLVPGGGPFADTVRALQAKLDFGDDTAHHMAMIAMEQYGRALAALWPRLVLAATPAAIGRALRTGQVACWAPAAMALASALPRSWDVTSDTLAAWLAGELRAEHLLLIKSVDSPGGDEATSAELAAAGVVDPLFPHFAAASGADIFLAGPDALKEAAARLTRGQIPGMRLRRA